MSGLSYRARRRRALVILLVGLPLYIIAAVSIIALFDRPGILVEFLIYVALGIVWALPFKMVFTGIGRPDPDARPDAASGANGTERPADRRG